MSNTFFIADTHFYHNNIFKFCRESRQGESIEEMNEIIIQNWNEDVKPEDTVWVLGDFSFGKKEQTEEILKRLQGKINFLRGNHDSQFDSDLKKYLYWCGDYKELPKKVLGEYICMMHFPLECWHKQEYGSLMLHGHVHGSSGSGIGHVCRKIKNRMDVGIDTRKDMRLYSWDDVRLTLKHGEY